MTHLLEQLEKERNACSAEVSSALERANDAGKDGDYVAALLCHATANLHADLGEMLGRLAEALRKDLGETP